MRAPAVKAALLQSAVLRSRPWRPIVASGHARIPDLLRRWARTGTPLALRRKVLSMRTATAAAVLLAFLAIPSCAQDGLYFPNLALGETQQQHDFVADWYTKRLKALGEPSMLQMSKTPTYAYRFLWLRTFHNPVAVRLNVNGDGTSIVKVKVTNGKGGYEPGELVKNETRKVDAQRTDWFLGQVERLAYWTLPTHESMNGCDEAEWVLEGVKDGRYKLVVRWSPERGPVRELGLAMLRELAGLKFTRRETY